ncbi:MAG: Mut7-C RNAse domain-containing protein [Anaerolineae bacterium]|nr:Mut7-C RNAse domain-containing protein [Anaerolineae bacterium]
MERTKDINPRFLADAMLGSLARWLRLLGCDTALAPSEASDLELVRWARSEDRVILTRDTELARRRGVRVIHIESMDLSEQLRQVVAQFEIKPERIGTRCLACNQLLEPLTREEARGRVPPYVWETHERFRHCPGCGRVYWAGTHWNRMRVRLVAMLGPEWDASPKV